MPTKSLELSRIYQQNRVRQLAPPRRITTHNVNKRSVITQQWIKQRRSSHAPTTSNQFYSKFEAVPIHVRQRDRMVASVMRKSNVLLRDASGPQERYFSQKETLNYETQARSSSPQIKRPDNILNTIDQEYVKRANFQRFQSQVKNSNFQKNVTFGKQEAEKDSVYRKTFHGSNSSSILEGLQRNKIKEREYSKREQASQFKLGLRDAGMMSEKQLSFFRIHDTPDIAKHSELERRMNLLKDQEDHVGMNRTAHRNSGEIIKGDRGPIFHANSGIAETVGMSGKNYRHMMSSESQKLTGGSNTASLQTFSQNRGMPKEQRDFKRQAEDNFREAKKIRDACYRSQVQLSGSKKGDYETSYATLYKWKAPRAFI